MSAFVGREKAVAAVTTALAKPPALVLVEGEAGIGKTRLVQEILWSGRWAERTVLMVECQPLATTAPLGAVVDGLRRLRDEVGGVQLSPLGGALRPLFPEWAADLPPQPEPLEDAGARRHQIIRALTELVDRIAVEVVVVEDAHWADNASLDWMNAVCASGHRGSVIVTYRREDVPSGSALWQLTSRRPSRMRKQHLELQPLDAGEVQQLAGAMFRRAEVSAEFAEFLHRRTGGLPLAVVECLKLMRDRGDIKRKDGGWSRKDLADIRVPPTVRDSVLERVSRLDRRTRRVLAAAAVLDEPADDRLLAAVAGLDSSQASAAVAVGFRAGLLRGAAMGRVAFRHQLAAQAVAEEIPAPELARLHQRAGEALRADGNVPKVRLSHHFREAGDTDTWAKYAEQSADLAMESGDDHTAVSMLYDLLTSVDHPSERRARLARKLGEAAAGGAANLIDKAGLVMDALSQVLADGDIPPGERGEIRLLLGRLQRWYGQVEAADSEIEAAITDLDDRPGLACRAMLNLGAALSRDWPVQEHLVWIERATVLLPRVEPEEWLAVAALRVSALLALGEEDGWRAAAELPQVGSSPSEQRTVLLSMADVGRIATRWGRYAEARARLGTATTHMRAAGYQRALSVVRAGCAYLDWYTGRWERLSQTAAELAEIDSTEQAIVRLEACEIQGLVALATGAPVVAEQHLAAVLDGLTRQARYGHQSATSAAALARLRMTEGRIEKALELTAPVMTKIANKGLWLRATDLIPVHLDALTHTGQLAQAEELAEPFAAWQADRRAPAPAAASLLCQGILAQAHRDLDKAAEWFAQSARAWAALPRPYDELLALERQGRCLLASNLPDQAMAVLTSAQTRLQDLGAQWDAGRIAQLLQQAGLTPDGWRFGTRLSPREREVLVLVAQGMTNKDVGRELFLSPRTVADYLASAMRKLHVTTRTAAAVAAADAGLIPADRPRG